jgi:hypothetical protein
MLLTLLVLPPAYAIWRRSQVRQSTLAVATMPSEDRP